MKIKISADSTCDLPTEIIEKYNIGLTHLYIIKEEKQYKDRIDITPHEIFKYVESGAGMTRSSAINTAEYIDYFTEWLQEYDAVIHISISHHFSACNQSAQIAAGELSNVYIVDSLSLSTGSGHIVLDAAIMAQQGKLEPKQIITELERLTSLVDASFVIGTLKYLQKGGRCSALQALGANLLKLNPCIEVTNGKMDVGKKYRGSFDKIILDYVEDRLKDVENVDTKRIFITYPPSISSKLVDEVKEKVNSLVRFDELIVSEAGCVISNHCGPICIGILFYRKTPKIRG